MKIQNIHLIIALTYFSFLSACNTPEEKFNQDTVREEIINTELEFNKAAKENGIQDAFYMFADENAVIKRQNDTLIIGNENIRDYYKNPDYKNVNLSWTPDFVGVSEDGTMAYTYGKYIWKSLDSYGKPIEYQGVFHTIWKKQKNGTWKYVWD